MPIILSPLISFFLLGSNSKVKKHLTIMYYSVQLNEIVKEKRNELRHLENKNSSFVYFEIDEC